MSKSNKIFLIFVGLLIVASTIFIIISFQKNNNTGEVWNNGTFYSVQSAYDNKLISRKELKDLSKIYIDKKLYDEFNNDYLYEIQQDYIEYYHKQATYDVEIMCCKEFDNFIAIWINDGLFTDMVEYETIGGVEFVYGSSQKLVIWKK